MKLLLIGALLCLPVAAAQEPQPTNPQHPTFTTHVTLVQVPALVRTKSGEPVFTLVAGDFTLTDDEIEQKATVEADAGAEPLALVIAIETGGAGARELEKYRNLSSLVEAVVGGVKHRVAVVSFDSTPRLEQDFTPDFNQIGDAIHALQPANGGPAILDSLAYSVDLLREQPAEYRKAILLVSETLDRASHTTLDEALRAVSDTNTAIYSLGFSTTKAAMRSESSKFNQPETPGPAGGCMAKDADADPEESRLAQAYECLSLLAPPLRAAKMAAILATNGMRRNVPESVAQLSGGEYFTLTDARGLERDLIAISHHLPNRYVLSFYPQEPHTGFHSIGLRLKNYPSLVVTARKGYWADSAPSPVPSQ
jgi:VWFA-related protein